MSKSMRISEDFHEYITAHNRDDETMEETLRRLIGGLDPRNVARILSEETANDIEEQIERKRGRANESKAKIRERFS